MRIIYRCRLKAEKVALALMPSHDVIRLFYVRHFFQPSGGGSRRVATEYRRAKNGVPV